CSNTPHHPRKHRPEPAKAPAVRCCAYPPCERFLLLAACFITTQEERMDTDDHNSGAPDARGGSAAVIRDLNDAFRQTLIGGKCVVTAGVAALGEATVTQLLDTVRRYSEFTPDNDPYGEHDFGAFDHAGIRFFW